MTVNIQEVLRYLGYKEKQADERTLALIDECASELERVWAPKHTYRRFPLEMTGRARIKAGPFETVSSSLAGNLKGCEEVVLFAATLGSGTDMLMNRYLRVAISKASVFQAVAAAAIEDYCDACQREIGELTRPEGLYLRPRFSPGYGDLPLTAQEMLLRALDAGKAVGIFLSDGGMMIPEKSVTALIGLSRNDSSCQAAGCEACDKTDCPYRR